MPIISNSLKFPAKVTAQAPLALNINGAEFVFSVDVDALALNITELDGEVSVMSFGADPTGVSNSSGAFQAAMAAIGSWGKINVPAGTYKLDTALTGNALWNVRHGATLTGSSPTLPGVTISTPNGRDQWSGALTGTVSGEYYHNSDIFTSDSLVNTGNTYCRFVKLSGRDPAAKGGRFSFGAQAQMDTPGNSAQTAGNAFYSGLFGQAIANYNHTTTGHVYYPSVFAGNSNVVATANAAGWGNIICHEFDTTAYAGSSYLSRIGAIFAVNGDGPQGTTRDAGISFIATPGATGLAHLFAIDKLSGGQPISTTGTILGVPSGPAMTIEYGIDLNPFTIANFAYRSPGFSVDGDGDVLGKGFSSNSDYLLVNATAPANQHFSRWSTDSNGAPRLQALDDSLAASTWVLFTRSGGTPAAAVYSVPVYIPASATLAGINIAPG